jgi:hypothetical protein
MVVGTWYRTCMGEGWEKLGRRLGDTWEKIARSWGIRWDEGRW